MGGLHGLGTRNADAVGDDPGLAVDEDGQVRVHVRRPAARRPDTAPRPPSGPWPRWPAWPTSARSGWRCPHRRAWWRGPLPYCREAGIGTVLTSAADFAVGVLGDEPARSTMMRTITASIASDAAVPERSYEPAWPAARRPGARPPSFAILPVVVPWTACHWSLWRQSSEPFPAVGIYPPSVGISLPTAWISRSGPAQTRWHTLGAPSVPESAGSGDRASDRSHRSRQATSPLSVPQRRLR